jgi:hypothetical protein
LPVTGLVDWKKPVTVAGFSPGRIAFSADLRIAASPGQPGLAIMKRAKSANA